jgi:thioredoxin 1
MNRILYFSAAWCGPCQTLGPIMEELRGEINYQKIDVDQNQDLPMIKC